MPSPETHRDLPLHPSLDPCSAAGSVDIGPLNHLQNLPPELLHLIFSFLGTDSLLVARETCRVARTIVNERRIWSQHRFRLERNYWYSQILTKVVERSITVLHLTIFGGDVSAFATSVVAINLKGNDGAIAVGLILRILDEFVALRGASFQGRLGEGDVPELLETCTEDRVKRWVRALSLLDLTHAIGPLCRNHTSRVVWYTAHIRSFQRCFEKICIWRSSPALCLQCGSDVVDAYVVRNAGIRSTRCAKLCQRRTMTCMRCRAYNGWTVCSVENCRAQCCPTCSEPCRVCEALASYCKEHKRIYGHYRTVWARTCLV
ncbi:hypothetical protein M427DRAFT_135226 [Gonapodya prolifera JEL478]|uniref:F-box domain-containing protein n=1 Tax=Gonapodya prolifera (strain JEL478) TaxID=1344416 RepID=A0A139AEL3_GONPJ|nr:hypothetical protein M427DRAFT_135226 [Gonapodya prolifera JEL478]|eukprot:KXS15266.1 hypothetical protein M427DRAFT_135226 [Gonapodya prolifera JEL478]